MSAHVISLLNCRVIPFPAPVPDATTLRRVRFAAMHAGCTDNQVRMVQGYAEGLLRAKRPAHEVVEAARSYAGQLLVKEPA